MSQDHENQTPSAEHRRLVHGRRKGRPFRAGQAALIDHVLPRIQVLPAACAQPIALFEAPHSESRSATPPELDSQTKGHLEALGVDLPQDWPATRVDSVWLEIGFGAGEHLFASAQTHPHIGIIGCEPFLNGVVSLVRDVAQAGLRNVRIYPDDARDVLDHLPESSIDACFIMFADPWPKKRHSKRRFVQETMLADLHRILSAGASLRLASDDSDLIDWYDAVLAEQSLFTWTLRAEGETQRPEHWPRTRYEAKGIEQGRTCVYYELTK